MDSRSSMPANREVVPGGLPRLTAITMFAFSTCGRRTATSAFSPRPIPSISRSMTMTSIFPVGTFGRPSPCFANRTAPSSSGSSRPSSTSKMIRSCPNGENSSRSTFLRETRSLTTSGSLARSTGRSRRPVKRQPRNTSTCFVPCSAPPTSSRRVALPWSSSLDSRSNSISPLRFVPKSRG